MEVGRSEAQERLLWQIEGHIQSWLSPKLHDGSPEARLRGLAHSILSTLDGADSPFVDFGLGYRIQPIDADNPFLNIAGDLAERMIE